MVWIRHGARIELIWVAPTLQDQSNKDVAGPHPDENDSDTLN